MDILLLKCLVALFCFSADVVVSSEYRSGEAPYIIEHPTDAVVARHGATTLPCRAGGQPQPTVRWYKAGIPVTSNQHTSLLPSGGLFFLRAQHSRSHSDAGVYWCEATNQHGTARSRNATLTVAVLREEFRVEPVNVVAAQGDTVVLECSPPRGVPEPQVFWKKDQQLLHTDTDSRVRILDGGSLEVQEARQTDSGRYQCIAKNAAGTRHSSQADLTIHIKPYLISGPEDVTAVRGGSVNLQCRVGGSPVPEVVWTRSTIGGDMPLDRMTPMDNGGLRLEDIVLEDEGQYTCEAENSVGAVSASSYLTVYDPPRTVLEQTTVNVEVGTTAKFTCVASGRPEPIVYWSVEGNRTIILPGTNEGKYQASALIDGVTELTIHETKTNQSGETIVCSAVNFAGSSLVRGKLVVTSHDDRPPPIITNGPSNQTLPIKSIAVFPCTATGTPEPVIAWYFEGEALILNHRINISRDGTLTLRELDKKDSGTYTCVAASEHGKYVWSGTLIVDRPTNPNIHFFRAADLNSLPGAPSKPAIYNLTDNSITISWSQSNKIGSSSIIGYQIEMFAKETLSGTNTARNSRGWEVLAKKVPQTHYIARSLTLGVTYMFIVRAENSHGISAPSPISNSINVGNEFNSMWDMNNNKTGMKNIMTDNIIDLVEATPIDSTTIKLMWEIVNFYYLEGLFIYYRPLDNLTTEYSMKTVLHSNDVSGYEITSLRKYTKYEFFLIPFYRRFEGKPSNCKVAQTLEDAPGGSPTNISVYIMNSSTVQLQWAPPEPQYQHGVIISYSVLLTWVDVPSNRSVVAVNSTVSSSSLTISSLAAGVSYAVQVAAATVIGLGPFSQKMFFNIESQTIGLDPISRYPEVFISTRGFVMETWFYFLVGAVVLLTVVVVATAIFYLRKYDMFAKKSALPNIYDSNGTALMTQMNIKTAVSLSNCYNKNTITNTESLLWVEGQPAYHMTSKQKINSDYDRVSQQLPEYAEVTCGKEMENKWNTSKTEASAYASVTLLADNRHCVSSLGWIGATGKQVERIAIDEEIYPSSNGGYYNRNVNSETYYQGRANMFKFYDLPTQKASLRYNKSPSDRRGETRCELTYGDPRRNAETETTYVAFGDHDSEDDDNGEEEMKTEQNERDRVRYQYSRPDVDKDAARVTSFRHQAVFGATSSLSPAPPIRPRTESIPR